jgi:hypothetical protein
MWLHQIAVIDWSRKSESGCGLDGVKKTRETATYSVWRAWQMLLWDKHRTEGPAEAVATETSKIRPITSSHTHMTFVNA